jgi:hypothetical protein
MYRVASRTLTITLLVALAASAPLKAVFLVNAVTETKRSRANLRKHAVSFEPAARVFEDPHATFNRSGFRPRRESCAYRTAGQAMQEK